MIRDNVSFGKLLESLRLKAGYEDAKGFGDKIGVSGQMVRDYERGISQPGYATLAKIAITLGVTVDSLIFGKDEKLQAIAAASPDVDVSHLSPEQQDDLRETIRILLTLQGISVRTPPMDVCPLKVMRNAAEESLNLLLSARDIPKHAKSGMKNLYGQGRLKPNTGRPKPSLEQPQSVSNYPVAHVSAANELAQGGASEDMPESQIGGGEGKKQSQPKAQQVEKGAPRKGRGPK